ncbi:16S rRNA (guanine(527)-N(7))-methyltransferase RsmG [Roseicyclus persicicus]|uniref:Ribosomal RNA small subunit methyltransferase G n=1 Tax=Roseicyclus persicicus TaxID=2650661 RepID=A0A7X6H0T0_9RHOB|nr:16S rRNA (guanine(527)-N(7))-methyltransferase RsmG [Roseibacterium persicicum]NKX45098.1 16S rRNA (guanine(527)-N(7))-methyltransferase RsmG [Roseibacterium persicicum]
MTEDEAKAALAARVSRETLGRLEVYAALLVKWQKTINLVAPSTLPQLWSRHILDSAQLMEQVPPGATRWLDLGSGGGFPGLVCAAIAAETHPGLRVTLVESDQRKAAFLREAARQMGVTADVIARRIEDLPPTPSDIVSARALAPLVTLCAYAHPHLVPGGLCLFQKGARHAEELATARQGWHIDCTVIPSVTDAEAVLLRIEQLSHA